jgi:hypothetical protein
MYLAAGSPWRHLEQLQFSRIRHFAPAWLPNSDTLPLTIDNRLNISAWHNLPRVSSLYISSLCRCGDTQSNISKTLNSWVRQHNHMDNAFDSVTVRFNIRTKTILLTLYSIWTIQKMFLFVGFEFRCRIKILTTRRRCYVPYQTIRMWLNTSQQT